MQSVFWQLSLMTAVVMVADFDGSKRLICAVIKTIDCGLDGECEYGTAEDTGIPKFLIIDFENSLISSIPESGPVRTTKIEQLHFLNGRLTMQGIQNGKTWSMIINTDNGKTTMSVNDDQVVFVLFGACTTR
jgi:hypothetical protein